MPYNTLIDLGHVPSVLVSAKGNKRFSLTQNLFQQRTIRQ